MEGKLKFKGNNPKPLGTPEGVLVVMVAKNLFKEVMLCLTK